MFYHIKFVVSPGVLQRGEVLQAVGQPGVRLPGSHRLAPALAGPLVPVVRPAAHADRLLRLELGVVTLALTAPGGHVYDWNSGPDLTSH